MNSLVASLLRDAFQRKSNELSLNTVEGTWIKITGTPYVDSGSREILYMPQPSSPDQIEEYMNRVGTFGSNNGRLAYIDGPGDYFLGRANSTNFEALQKAGYKEGGLFVPFSNGEQPLDAEVKYGLDLLRHGFDSEVNGHEVSLRRAAQVHAEENGIAELSETIRSQFVVLDGTVINNFGELTYFPTISGDNMRLEQIGQRDYNNGVIAVVNERGQIMVAKYSEDISIALKDAGYGQGSGSFHYTPLSNSESIAGYIKPGAFDSNGVVRKEDLIEDTVLDARFRAGASVVEKHRTREMA